MTDRDAELPAPQDSGMWWNEGEWQPIPPGTLNTDTSSWVPAINAGTSSWVLEINADEYPELSELVRYADDVDGYLEMLGVGEDSISELDDSSAVPSEGEETMGMGE
jgi:hypothetical protein